MNSLRPLFSWMWSQKWKGLIILALVPFFVLILFPMRDLSDLVTSQVSHATNNQIYVQFDEMGLSIFPSFGMRFDKFSLETPTLPPLAIQKLNVSPSVTSLITQKPAGSVFAEGIFRGEASISVKPGKKLENGAQTQAITLKADKIQLADLKQFLSLPVMLRGGVNVSADGNVDLSMSNQPDISFDVQSGKLELTSSVLNLPLGPVVLPDLTVSKVTMKGRLSAGTLLIEETQIGKEGDELYGKLSGQFNVELRNISGNIVPMQGAYSYKVDIWASQSFEERAKFFLSLVDQHKTPEGQGHRYRFTLTGDARTGQFNVNPLR